MALLPKLAVTAIAKDASSVSLKDTTGTYNASTNTGGYGSPNPVVPTRIGIMWRYWSNTTSYQVVSTSISLQTAYEVTPELFGLTGVFADGVHNFKSFAFELLTGTYLFTLDSKTVTRATGTVNLLSTFTSTLYTALEIGGKIYEIDFTVPLTETTLTLKEVFAETTTTTTMYKGAKSDLKLLVNKAAAKVFCQHVHRMSEQDCELDEDIKLTSKMNMFLQAAEIHMLCKHYQKAHDLVSYVADFYSYSENCYC